jgi:hypothetical protein
MTSTSFRCAGLEWAERAKHRDDRASKRIRLPNVECGRTLDYVNAVRIKLLIALFVALLLMPGQRVAGGSIGDFFKALGNSISHPEKNKAKPKNPPVTTKHSKTKGSEPAPADYPPAPTATPMPTATPTATLPIRVASAPSQSNNSKRDIPYAIPVPNKPGFVTSPYSPKQGLVDVRGFPSGTEVKDPYSGKTFLTP